METTTKVKKKKRKKARRLEESEVHWAHFQLVFMFCFLRTICSGADFPFWAN
jgi:hypothetical protein